MLTTLNTSYTDTRAGDLAWCLGSEELPALAVLDLRIGPVDLQLRLLGASHQVVLGSGATRCSETVACLPGRRTPLPARVAERIQDREYEFAAQVETLPERSFAGRANELLALVENHPYGLAGVFPGDPTAFTALLAGGDERSISWRTWHAYPQEGRLVCTRSSLSVRDWAEEHPTGAGAGAGAGSRASAGAGPRAIAGAGPRAGAGVGTGREAEAAALSWSLS